MSYTPRTHHIRIFHRLAEPLRHTVLRVFGHTAGYAGAFGDQVPPYRSSGKGRRSGRCLPSSRRPPAPAVCFPVPAG